ncbi:MAG: hypothetical protein KAT74_11305 [Candidatus Cloacimonetes bacterium]|nr:hypothetical protein [Candidatus Cloacimonadota bacterium]
MKYIKNLKFFLIFIISLMCINWYGDFSSPEKAFESLVEAAKTDNIDNFLDCCDLEAMSGLIQTEENIHKISDSLKKDKQREKIVKGIMNFLSKNKFSIIKKVKLDIDMQILYISKNNSEEISKVLFRKKQDKWKLSGVKNAGS